MFAHEAVGHTGETPERIFDARAEQLLADHLVIERHAQRELRSRLLPAVPEFEIVLPAGEEELPLQIGHLDQFRALLRGHARIFKRYEERWHERALSVAQIIEQV